jgi:hypothetical protein
MLIMQCQRIDCTVPVPGVALRAVLELGRVENAANSMKTLGDRKAKKIRRSA